MPFKNEHPLNIGPEIKRETAIDDDFAQDKRTKIKSDDSHVKIQNKNAEVKKIVDTKSNITIKNEHPLNTYPEIKKTTGVDDGCAKTEDTKAEVKSDIGCTETPDKKVEVQNIYDTEPEPVKERPLFRCQNCDMTERYDYFSDHTPFNRSVRTQVDYYLARDPFSPHTKRQFLILGSVCSICDRDVCIKPECSIFYSKFYCSICARKNIANFPSNIRNKIIAAKRI